MQYTSGVTSGIHWCCWLDLVQVLLMGCDVGVKDGKWCRCYWWDVVLVLLMGCSTGLLICSSSFTVRAACVAKTD